MFVNQKHDENDNGNDQIWIFKSEEHALARFNELCDHYKRICSDEGERDEWNTGARHYVTHMFTNADGTTTTFSLSEVDYQD